MRKIAIILGACAGFGFAPAGAEGAGDAYQPFEVTRSVPRRGVSVTRFDVAGAAVSVNAYGRKARARLFNSLPEVKDQRLQAAAFDPAAKPALMTIEMRLHF